ncbi:serine/Arginine-related protein 53-like [Haliotis rufescens]|uniref:serine/Arginine-related protein 53-like n=1 Tax=Haliotis rufescens TaxID=6454 RepID=UPI00201E8EDB|nr:serine/Arginine-related protein 53-like [Haliotis rufescens]
MGRYSDSDDDYDLKKSKKKKRRKSRSRSRSASSGSSRYSSKHKKSKKTKHKKRSRSRSRDRPLRRSRSRSRGRRSRSRERHRSRSRSLERNRDRYRSRSRDRHTRRRSRSNSRSRARRSRSDSRSRGRRSRSDSRGRSRRSRSRSRGRRSRSPEKKKNRSRRESPAPKDIQADIREQIPGFDDMTPGEQASARMRLALKAAAAADEKIREQLQESGVEDTISFNKAVANIEADKFKPAVFKSNRGDKIKTEPADDGYTTHEQAMFGSGKVNIKLDPVKPVYIEPDSYAHPNLHGDSVEKMQRWLQKLSAMRKKKLEGEAL